MVGKAGSGAGSGSGRRFGRQQQHRLTSGLLAINGYMV